MFETVILTTLFQLQTNTTETKSFGQLKINWFKIHDPLFQLIAYKSLEHTSVQQMKFILDLFLRRNSSMDLITISRQQQWPVIVWKLFVAPTELWSTQSRYTQLREWTIHLLHECIIMRVEEAIISLKWMKIGGFPFNEKVLSRAENVYDVINQLWLFL